MESLPHPAPRLNPAETALSYRARFRNTWDENLGWENARFVVLDTESTGTDVRRDHLISIGGIGVMHFQVMMDDAFEVVMPIAHNTSSVMFHGITKEEARSGIPEPEALARFLSYLGDAIIVGHHIGHDIALLNHALGHHFDLKIQNLRVDTMELTLKLEALGAFPAHTPETAHDFTLDGLCRRFHITPHDRHTAAGDAFLTAQIFLKLLKIAKRTNLLRLGQLTATD